MSLRIDVIAIQKPLNLSCVDTWHAPLWHGSQSIPSALASQVSISLPLDLLCFIEQDHELFLSTAHNLMASHSDSSTHHYEGLVRQKARYGRYLDTKQWHSFVQIALPDARFRFQDVDGSIIFRNGTGMDFDSLSSFVDYFRELFADAQTLHMFGPPDVQIERGEQVEVIWAMEDQLHFGEDSPISELRGGGYYYEIWVKTSDGWRLKDLTLRRTYSKVCLHSECREGSGRLENKRSNIKTGRSSRG